MHDEPHVDTILALEDEATPAPAKHGWFGAPEIIGYIVFIFLATVSYTAARPGLLPMLANRYPVLESIEARNVRELPGGIVSLDLFRMKVRNGTPLSVVFYLVNDLTAEGDKGIRILPYHASDDCKTVDASGGDVLYTHRVGPIITHFCFKLPEQVAPDVDYGIRGEMQHSAWPFYGLVPTVKTIPEFHPRKQH